MSSLERELRVAGAVGVLSLVAARHGFVVWLVVVVCLTIVLKLTLDTGGELHAD